MAHPSIPTAHRRSALRWRHGCLWNNKLAKRWGKSNTDKCPLCGEPDSAGHITGSCRHPEMQRMYIERHHHTGRILLRAIAKGSMGGDLVMADLGTRDKCTSDGAPVLEKNIVPPSLLPPFPPDAGSESTPNSKTKMQPDALLVHNASPCRSCECNCTKGHCPGCKPNISFTIVEFKYCRDTAPQDQLTACMQKHAQLSQQLQLNCYGQQHIKTLPILVGTSGTVYNSHTLDNMEALGISPYHAKKCASKMHLEAIKFLHSIIQTRRRLEHFPSGHPDENINRIRQQKRQRPP